MKKHILPLCSPIGLLIYLVYRIGSHYMAVGDAVAIPAMIGGAALLADGIITPPISVASAIEGLDMIIPGLPTVPIVIVILSLLFFFQRFGTQKVGGVFGPVMVIWFTMLLAMGLREIIQFPDVVKALKEFYVNVDVEDPHADSDELQHEYGFKLTEKLSNDYDAVIVTVPHGAYKDYDDAYFAGITKKDAIIADLKGIYRNKISGRTYWSL